MRNKFLTVNPIRADVAQESRGGRAEARRAGRAGRNPSGKAGALNLQPSAPPQPTPWILCHPTVPQVLAASTPSRGTDGQREEDRPLESECLGLNANSVAHQDCDSQKSPKLPGP